MPSPQKNSAPSNEPAPQKPGFVMPRPGSVVLWTHTPGAEQSVAVVTRVGKQAISVNVFPPDQGRGTPKDGVRHIDDPWLKANHSPDSGVWDFTDEAKRLAALEQALSGLK